MRFEKWQALGNDYLIVERDELPFDLTPARVRRLCDSHLGAGADGVLLLSPAARSRARGRPADIQPGRLRGGAFGEWRARGDHVSAQARVDGPERVCDPERRPARSGRRSPGRTPAGWTWAAQASSQRTSRRSRRWAWRARVRDSTSPRHGDSGMCRSAIRSARSQWQTRLSSRARPARIGPGIEGNEMFPNRTNVSWYTEVGEATRARIRARIFERGVGETLSSGTGATGAAVAYRSTSRRGRSASDARDVSCSTAVSWRSRWERICTST